MAPITLYQVRNNALGPLASLAEKRQEYDNVAKQKKGYKASWYKQHTTLVMKEFDIDVLTDTHITTFYTQLTRINRAAKVYPIDFDKLPKTVQMALFGMIFNLGAIKIVTVFGSFDKAIKAGDWKKAAQHMYRYKVNQAHNQYVNQLFPAAAFGKP